MKKIGILGTSTIFELGYSEDVDLFFTAISEILEQGHWGREYPVVMLKLYKKTLDLDEIKKAKIEIDKIQLKFSQITLNDTHYFMTKLEKDKTSWNIQAYDFSGFFNSFFNGFNTAYSMTISLNEKYGEYSPMLLGGTSIKYATEDIMMPVEEYDTLSEKDLPFWKR